MKNSLIHAACSFQLSISGHWYSLMNCLARSDAFQFPLVSTVYGLFVILQAREWNEEIIQAREMPQASLSQRVIRLRAMFKVLIVVNNYRPGIGNWRQKKNRKLYVLDVWHLLWFCVCYKCACCFYIKQGTEACCTGSKLQACCLL